MGSFSKGKIILNTREIGRGQYLRRAIFKSLKIFCLKRRLAISLLLILFLLIPKTIIADLEISQRKFIGNVLPVGGDTEFATYWNQVTLGNVAKWDRAEVTRDNMNWGPVDPVFEYARGKSFPVKQHGFIWKYQPEWMIGLPADEQKAEVAEWMEMFCQQYPDVQYIDVVNEPVYHPPPYKIAIGGDGVTGWDWVIWAFQEARTSCPNAKLLVNEIGVELNDSKMTQYISLIRLLNERGLLDGIGIEGHGLEGASSSEIKASLDRLASLGLPIYISELDIRGDDDTQLSIFEQLFPVMWEHPGVYGITLLGYRENRIWRPTAYLIRSDGSERPALTWLKTYLLAPMPPTNVRIN